MKNVELSIHFRAETAWSAWPRPTTSFGPA